MNKLTREIDGHKFYSKGYSTEREAKNNALKGFYALYEDGKWFNYNSVLGFQEDVHEKP